MNALSGLGSSGGVMTLTGTPSCSTRLGRSRRSHSDVRLGSVEMKATANAIGGQVVEITGNIQNKGDRSLRSVFIFCIFHDAYGQVVLKERLEIVKQKLGGLQPGEMKSFRLPFDSIPESWNQGMPQLVIANIQFG